ncbi:MAG: hypothetical protein ACOYK6_02430 [Chthoniobacterales bacterium]
MKLISRLSSMFLAVLTMALMMMTSSSSQAQTIQSLDKKIITFTVEDYREFQKATNLDQVDQDKDDILVDLKAAKTDWTAQQAEDFREWKNSNKQGVFYNFLEKSELLNAIKNQEVSGTLSTQWILSENKEGGLLLFDSSSGDVGALSLLQTKLIINKPSSRNNDDSSSVNHTDKTTDSSSKTSSSNTTQTASKSTTWFTTRNMLIAAGVTLLVVGGIAFFALGGAAALGLGASGGAVGGAVGGAGGEGLGGAAIEKTVEGVTDVIEGAL